MRFSTAASGTSFTRTQIFIQLLLRGVDGAILPELTDESIRQ
jgi:hypothetical protein